MQWTFKPRGDQKVRNPLGEEFFNSPDLLTDTSSLVREAIQNSLDARVDDNEPVRVRFKIGKISDPNLPQELFGGLEIHAQTVLGDSRGRIGSSCRFLVYEDFNTEGLRGDSTVDRVPSSVNKADANYTYFVHYEGEGNKGDGKRGKWGVGKIVFPMISSINAFFAYSIRDDEYASCGNNPVLIGQCTLKFHEIGGETFQPDGWFSPDANSVPQPFSGHQAKEIARRWNIARREETGLSVIIPYITSEVGIPQLRDAVIRQYFIAILGGDLQCDFEDENGGTITLDQGTLTPFLNSLGELTEGSSRDLRSLQISSAIGAFTKAVELAEESDEACILWEISDTKTAPSHLGVPTEVLEAIKRSLDEHAVAWLKVSFPIPKQFIRGSDLGDLELLLWKEEGSSNPVIYSREGILVPGSQAVNIAQFGALIMTDSGPLADLLGSSEGPAHEDWSENTERFKALYEINLPLAARAIRLVRLLPKRLQQELTKKENLESDDSFFSDWFSNNELEAKRRNSNTAPQKEKGSNVDVPAHLPVNPRLSVSASVGTVTVTKGSQLCKKGDFIKIKTAYAVSKGNAFTGWSDLDFTFLDKASIRIKDPGLKLTSKAGNSLLFEVLKPDNWRVELVGFDVYRDLEVQASIEVRSEESKNGN